MAIDKLVDSTQLDADLTSVANAIRTKGGTSAQLAFPADFVSAVEAIETGGGGDYVADDWLDVSKPSGAVSSNTAFGQYAAPLLNSRTGITSLSLPNATHLADSFCSGCAKLATIYAPKVTGFMNNALRSTAIVYAVFPALGQVRQNSMQGCTKLVAADFGGSGGGFSATSGFSGCSILNVLVLRKSGVWTLNNINVFSSTPFASGKSGGTLYVPSAQIANYQAATNWSTILGYANNQIKSIESTHTDPDAPIDLTLYYVDGTPLPA